MKHSDAVLRHSLSTIRSFLKRKGFVAKGRSFSCLSPGGNTLVLSVQKSTKSSAISSDVTINYGVFSSRLGRRLEEDIAAATDVTRAHWRRRLQNGGKEEWITVDASGSPDHAGSEMTEAVERVLDDLSKHATDEALRDEWLSGSSPGIGAMQRLLYLAILVDELGPVDKMPAILSELQTLVAGSVHEQLIEDHLLRMGIRGNND